MKRSAAVLLAALVAAVGLSIAPVGAKGVHDGSVLVVDQDPHDRKCRTKHVDPDRIFPTIQEAVDAAGRGDTIKVCPGLYEETVTVNTPNLTILGAKAGQDARWRDRRHESEVTFNDPDGVVRLNGNNIVWDGFWVRDNAVDTDEDLPGGPGLSTSEASSGSRIRNTIFTDNGIGIDLGSEGERRTKISQNLFVANNEFEEPGAGSGVYSDRRAADVHIIDNRFQDHNQAGILFADHGEGGATVQDVLIARNKSIDDRSFATFFDSSRVCVTGNLVRANPEISGNPPEPAAAIFVGSGSDGVVVQFNKILSASGSGIAVRDTAGGEFPIHSPLNVRVLKNKITGVQEHGVDVSASAPGEYEVRGNRAFRNDQVGIHLGPEAGQARVRRNTALGNGVLDCQDEPRLDVPTAELDNTWEDNTGVTEAPEGICSPPDDDDRGHHGKPKYHKKKHHKKQHHHHSKPHDKKHHGKKHHGTKAHEPHCIPCRF